MKETAETKLARVVDEFIERNRLKAIDIPGFGSLYEASLAHGLDMLQRVRLHPVASERTEDLAPNKDEANGVIADLRMLVQRLARSLRLAKPDNALSEEAIDYLKRKGLTGSPLREEPYDVYKSTYERWADTLQPAFDYVQGHQKQFKSGPGDDKVKIIADWFVATAPNSPKNEHADDMAVDAFAHDMKHKMRVKREQGYGGWQDEARCTTSELTRMLHEHVDKGDPVDVANFCMMLKYRGARIEAAATNVGPTDAMIYPEEMTQALRHVLSKMCFEFISICQLFRASGIEIDTRAEAEQAYCLHWLIKLVLKHGDEWAAIADAELKNLADARKAAAQATGSTS